MNVMMLSVPIWSGNVSDMLPEQRDFFHWLSALVVLPAAAYAGQPFFRSAFRALRSGGVNMDVPICVGVILALGMSLVETIFHAEHAYFDAAIMLLTFLLMGRYLDQNMRRRTRAYAGNLAALKADTATKIMEGGDAVELPVAAIKAGDKVLVRPGDRCSVDGIVLTGRSEIDQSVITGETRYATVESGSNVYAGSMNVTGTLTIQVASAADGTLLAEISRLLENAVQNRSRYVRIADRASRLYAPVVHLTALSAMLGWLAFGASWHEAAVIAIAVLIITCPCALGLAIPAVQTIAAGAMFRSGVLLNTGDAIERCASVDTVLFDKTGTLTLPELDVVNASSIPQDLLEVAGRLALASRHPVAAAVARSAQARLPLPDVTEEAGRGVRALFEGVEVRLGSPDYCDARQEATGVVLGDPEVSAVAFRHGDRCCVFAVRQRLRPDAAEVVALLQKRGIAVEILSGDREEAVRHTASALGIQRWTAGMLPSEKIARIQLLKQQRRKVMMVGDGLNDAPALAAASISMSPASASQISQTTADMVFVGSNLNPVALAILFSSKAYSLMRQNLALAIGYNFLAVPIAIAGYTTPLIAAAAMSGSSVLVMLNSLRARSPAGERMPWKF